MLLWAISLALFLIWLGGVLYGKGGYLHILLLTAIAIAVVEWVAKRRAARG